MPSPGSAPRSSTTSSTRTRRARASRRSGICRRSGRRSSASSRSPSTRRRWMDADKELTNEDLRERLANEVEGAYQRKVEQVGAPVMRHLEKAVMLQELDRHWREHLAAMDYLRQGIHLRAYAQKNPKQEYKREAFELFSALLDRIKHGTITLLSRLQVRSEAEIEAQEREHERQLARRLQTQHAAPPSAIGSAADEPPAGIAPMRPPAAASRAPGGAIAPGPHGGARAGCSRSCATAARSGATSPVPAARARSTSTATVRSPAKPEAAIEVVAGALVRRRMAASLIAQRPAGKPLAGRWEFPGGKLRCRRGPRTRASSANCARSLVSVVRPPSAARYAYRYRGISGRCPARHVARHGDGRARLRRTRARRCLGRPARCMPRTSSRRTSRSSRRCPRV